MLHLFSVLKKIKNILGSLFPQKLNALAVMCIESEITFKIIDFKNSIDKFAKLKLHKKNHSLILINTAIPLNFMLELLRKGILHLSSMRKD